MIYGYARVATDGQSVDAQVRQLTKAGRPAYGYGRIAVFLCTAGSSLLNAFNL
jgi:DNA invertase Pin-like site-specific DNA recombinase